MIQSACRTFLWTGRNEVSRRALIAWEKVILPKQDGGLNIGNLKVWNQAAICKLLWNIHQQKNRTWIRWIHGYYIKGRDVFEMSIPQQSSWVVKKILEAREYLEGRQHGMDNFLVQQFSIRKMYNALIGEVQRVPWAKMLCQNSAPAKCLIISWLLLHERLATCSYLLKLGVVVDPVCCFCEEQEESLDHMLAEWCGISRQAEKWEIENTFLMSQCTNNNVKQRLYRCVFSVVSYHLWRERNARRLQGKKTTEDIVVRQCQFVLAVCRQKDRRL